MKRINQRSNKPLNQIPDKPRSQTTKPVVKVITPCHKHTEVIPGLVCGDYTLAKDVKVLNLDVIMPLAELPVGIWSTGWRGVIDAVPIEDYSVLPPDVLDATVNRVIRYIQDGAKVGVYCFGGHGRTGYLAACIIGRLRPDLDPIAFLRECYCKKAVESNEQVEAIAEYLERPELMEHKAAKEPLSCFTGIDVDWWETGSKGGDVKRTTDECTRGGQVCISHLGHSCAYGLQPVSGGCASFRPAERICWTCDFYDLDFCTCTLTGQRIEDPGEFSCEKWRYYI